MIDPFYLFARLRTRQLTDVFEVRICWIFGFIQNHQTLIHTFSLFLMQFDIIFPVVKTYFCLEKSDYFLPEVISYDPKNVKTSGNKI